MIARIWHRWTTTINADVYQRIVSTEVLPEIAARQIVGYRGAHLLRRSLANGVELITIGCQTGARLRLCPAFHDAGPPSAGRV